MVTETRSPFRRLLQPGFIVMLAFAVASMGFFCYSTRIAGLANEEHCVRTRDMTTLFFTSFAVDNTDAQWASVRSSMFLLAPGVLGIATAGRLLRQYAPALHVPFLGLSGFVFTVVAHGGRGLVAVPLQLLFHFFFSTLHARLPYASFMIIMWAYLLAMVLGAEHSRGWAALFEGNSAPFRRLEEIFGRGVIGWQVTFNVTMLRLIAFACDRFEANTEGAAELAAKIADRHRQCLDCVEAAQKHGGDFDAAPCYKRRTDTSRPPAEYSFANYIAYVYYVPLYIGGPITSFNAFASHLRTPQQALSGRSLVVYGARVVGLYVFTQVFVAIVPVNCVRGHESIMTALPLISSLSAGVASLPFLWLKFSVLWRGFRFAGLIEGTESPEDMPRCFNSTTTIANFWRGWHASFNLWTVRYMYIPMGGRRNQMLSIVPIFLFMAIWHDTALNLIGWAAIMIAVFIPEMIIGRVFASKSLSWVHRLPGYDFLLAFARSVCVAALVFGNAVGYGTKDLAVTGVSQYMTTFDILICLAYTVSSAFLGEVSLRVRNDLSTARAIRLGVEKHDRSHGKPS